MVAPTFPPVPSCPDSGAGSPPSPSSGKNVLNISSKGLLYASSTTITVPPCEAASTGVEGGGGDPGVNAGGVGGSEGCGSSPAAPKMPMAPKKDANGSCSSSPLSFGPGAASGFAKWSSSSLLAAGRDWSESGSGSSGPGMTPQRPPKTDHSSGSRGGAACCGGESTSANRGIEVLRVSHCAGAAPDSSGASG